MKIYNTEGGSYILEFSNGKCFWGDKWSFPLDKLDRLRSFLSGNSEDNVVLLSGPKASGKDLLTTSLVQEIAGSDYMFLCSSDLTKHLTEMLTSHRDDKTGDNLDANMRAYIEKLSSKSVLVVDEMIDITYSTGLESYVTEILHRVCLNGTRVLLVGPMYADSSLERMALRIMPGHSVVILAQLISSGTAQLFAKERAKQLGLNLSDAQIGRLVDGLCAYPPLINSALLYCHLITAMGIPVNISEITNIFNKRAIKDSAA